MKKESENYDLVSIDLSEKDSVELMNNHLDNKQPVALMGPPGCGKTQFWTQVAKQRAEAMKKTLVVNPKYDDWLNENNFCFATLIGAKIQEIDALGLPHIKAIVGYGDITEFTPTTLFPRVGTGMIFLDEIGNALESVKNALQDYLTGGGEISSDILLVAATNSMEDNSGVSHIGYALRNRMAWYKIEYPDVESWLKLMDKIGRPIEPKIAFYLKSIGGKNFITYDPEKEQYAYSTPRSLERASNAIKDKTDLEMMRKLVGGILGNSWSAEWSAWVQLSEKVDISEILAHPEKIKLHEDQLGTLYSICAALCENATKKAENTDKVLDVVMAMTRDEFGMLIIGELIKKHGVTKFVGSYLVKRKDFMKMRERFLGLLNAIETK